MANYPARYMAIVTITLLLLGGLLLIANGGRASLAAGGSAPQYAGPPTATPIQCANQFSDIEGDTFYTAIHTLACLHLVSGTDPTHYSPAATASRAQFARVVVKSFGLSVTTPVSPTFSDVPPSYFAYADIESGVAAGILSGYDAGGCAAGGATYPCFLPNKPITRAELTKLTVKAIELPHQHPLVQTFSDVPTTYFAYHYIEIAYVNHIITGTGQTRFSPDVPIRRDEMASIVYAGLNVFEQNKAIEIGAPEPYLGVGSQLASQRSGDPSMRIQDFWLSLHSPGVPKENGDPFTAKWDYTVGGCNGCYPVGGPFQPDRDTRGYNFDLFISPGDAPLLQIYDAAYQPKPIRQPGQGFDQAHPCDNYNAAPSSCSSGDQIDYNRLVKNWCADNAAGTDDNQPGASSQCSTQSSAATTIYSLYYPDDTPWYFNDDVLSDTWTVPAAPITGTNDGVNIVPSFAYSQTWANFMGQSDQYQLYSYYGNRIWRLNVSAPRDNNHGLGLEAQNNFAIRLQTAYASTYVHAPHQMPFLGSIRSGITDFYLANVPGEDAGKTLIISLFDPGDANGTNYIGLMAPPDATHAYSQPVSFDYYVHDGRHNPPGPDEVYLNRDSIDATRPTYNFNDDWVDIVYQIPQDTLHGGTFYGGYFTLRYTYTQGSQDRTTWRVTVR